MQLRREKVVSRLFKDEHDILKLGKKAIYDQYKKHVKSLSCKHKDFMNKMEQKYSKWFNKIHKEHLNFLLGFEMQKKELESSIDKRHEDI